MESLGERIRNKRKNAGLTLKEMSLFTDLSISYLSDIERGRTMPSLKTLDKIAAEFCLDAWGLLAPDYVVQMWRESQLECEKEGV